MLQTAGSNEKIKTMTKEIANISIGVVGVGVEFHTRIETLCLQTLDLIDEVGGQPYDHGEGEGVGAWDEAERLLHGQQWFAVGAA